MSGICGITHLDGTPVDPAQLRTMTKAVGYRGPDGIHHWIDGHVGLAHLALHTTPESQREKQPLLNHRGDIVLTADARADNRDELIYTLTAKGYLQTEVPTDADLILAAYECWGEACPEHIIGDFAFAVWDGRKQTLFCARDHLGIKPFYYCSSGQIFVFASQIKALLSLPEVPRRLNEVRVADYLIPNFEDQAITFYQDILRLPPGHSITVNHAGTRLWAYWSLDPSRELRLGSDDEYAEAFRELFADAVRCRIRSAFPVGSLLSGGLDSSAVACMARALLADRGGHHLHTFSAIFDDVPECDERTFINAALAQEGLTPHYVHADQLSPLTDLDQVLFHEDEAFYTPNLFMHWGLFGSARDQGVRVLLDGLDGDTTVSHGIAHLTELAYTGRWIALFQEVKWLSRRFDHLSPWTILRRRVLKPLVPGSVWRAWQARRGWKVFNPTINPDFARRIDLTERLDLLENWRVGPVRVEREEHHRRLASGHITFVLEVADKAAAAFAIESRYPFFDKRLVEFCLALPPEQKIHHGWTRMVMRRAMEGILPTEIQWRGGKSNLGANFRRGLLTADRELVEEAILRNPQAIAAYVDVDALRETYARCLSQPTDTNCVIVWKAASLALWLRCMGLATPSQ